MPRLGTLLCLKEFQRRIGTVNVDEAHFIHTAGVGQYGLPAFRPAWGKLSKLKVILPSSIPWRAMSATFTQHILKTVASKILRPGYVFIHTTSNWPNTIYTTHCVPQSGLQDLQNYECFITKPFNLATQPCVLLFFDDRKFACAVATHLESLLPLAIHRKGIVQCYHSLMSEEFLHKVHDDFTTLGDGPCKVLCATSGESVVSFLNDYSSRALHGHVTGC